MEETMNNKTRQGIWLAAGAYLVYTGFQLVADMLKDRPDNYAGFMAAGIIFMVFGAAVVIRSIKAMRKPDEPDEGLDETEEDEELS